MLAEAGRRRADVAYRIRELDREPKLRNPTLDRVIYAYQHLAMPELQVIKGFGQPIDRRERNIDLGEIRYPFVAGSCRKKLLQSLRLHLRLLSDGPLSIDQLLEPDSLAEASPKMRLDNAKRDMLAVSAAINIIAGRLADEGALSSARLDTGKQEVGAVEGEPRCSSVSHRNIDVLAAPRVAAGDYGRQDTG